MSVWRELSFRNKDGVGENLGPLPTDRFVLLVVQDGSTGVSRTILSSVTVEILVRVRNSSSDFEGLLSFSVEIIGQCI